MKMKKHSISLRVANKPGVLIRISLVFARRGYNIDSLVVSESNDRNFSSMNITATGDPETLHLMLNQLNRLVDVVHAKEHNNENALQRELALVKVKCEDVQRTDVLQIADVFKARNMDISDHTITFQVTGSSSKLDAFQELLKPYGIVELIRSGNLIMARGSESTT
ncbi:acetolactate synthase small subunit [Thiospirochaeta perfilievii]|uniref:Acetolactate synthase small subunit n=1 Tax=Thiospirochaeta perfilievii TaxID=252967 RepID=A0A5C1Q9L6_9SPIO|nr:acetolactate synthase small subunit [Thiospirochaeta perfilievii]QEN03486.1 acetolactate synthase small subunit [Thiospirochaeta perfilievii]